MRTGRNSAVGGSTVGGSGGGRRFGTAVVAAGLAIAAAGLTGCGGSGPIAGPKACGSGSSSGCTPPPSPTAQAAPAVSTAHGLVLCQPTGSSPAGTHTAIALQVVSPQNEKVEASATLHAVPGQEQNNDLTSGPNAPVACAPGPVSNYNQDVPEIGPEEFAARQRFNADFTEMAVIIQKPSSGTADAGYMSLATGKVTDVTGAGSSSFGSASGTAQDALFNPTTDALWYLTSKGVPYSVAASGHGTAHPVGYASSLAGSSGDAPGYISLAPQTSWVLSDTSTGLPNPSGTVAVGAATTNTGGQLRIWAEGTDLTQDISDTKTMTAINVKGWPGGLPNSSQNPAPIAWLSDTRFIMLRASQFYIVTFSHGYASATSGPGLLPSNGYQFIQGVLSPNRQTLAFTVNKGGATDYLYELALNQPGAQPKEIGPLGTTSAPWAILAWR